MKITILVASHKQYNMPQDPIYRAIQVGAAVQDQQIEGFTPDNTGTNLSAKNPFYNELTALYWAKYNLTDQDVIGLAHYRRFLGRKSSHSYNDLLTDEEIEIALQKYDILLPKQRNYFIETQEEHYLNAHDNRPYNIMMDVIAKQFPEYLPALTEFRKSRTAHMFNISIMPQVLFQDYTDFVFAVLNEVEKQTDFDQLNGQDKRAMGYLGERLMDVWIRTRHLKIAEYPLVTTEKTNWLEKGWYFLLRHFGHQQNTKTHF